MFAFSRKIQVFYVAILSAIFFGLMASLFFLWNGGPVQMEGVFSMVESSMKLERLKKGQDLERIQNYIETDRARQSLQTLKKWEKQTKLIHQTQPHEQYSIFQKELDKTYKSLEDMISLPQANKIVSVLNEKVNSFRDFVVKNNWRTLTRISGRTRARLQGQETRKDSYFSYKNLKNLRANLEKDISQMRRVTVNSILSQEEKDRILNKLDSLGPELKMLESYVKGLGGFQKQFANLKLRADKWVSAVSPKLSLKMIDIERVGNLIFFGIVGLATFVFLSLLGGAYLYSRSKDQSRKKVEDLSLQIVRDGIIPLDDHLPQVYSSEFREELEKYREYVHKRMSFGSVFQEAVPFSSLMLDSNLNLVWANELFYDVWSLKEEKSKEGNISWDFLQQYTNLGENDPVLTALNENVAGIYQIQIRTQDESDGQPYEMYVSPVDYAGQSRIMIFFYPLRSIQETIGHQIRAIVGPVGRTLDSLAGDRFRGEEFDKLKKDFEIAGIEELFEKFCSYDVEVTEQKEELLNEIRYLENKICEQTSLYGNLEAHYQEKITCTRKMMESFERTKEAIIRFSQHREKLEQSFHHVTSQSKDVFRAEGELFQLVEKLNGILTDNIKTFERIQGHSQEFKSMRQNLEDSRTRLMQTLEQTMVFQRMNGGDAKLEQTLYKIKSEIKAFDQSLATLSKAATNVDVSVSKLGHQLQDVDVPDLSTRKEWFEEMRESVEGEMFEVGKNERAGQQADESLIHELQNLFHHFENLRKEFKSSRTVFESFEQERQEFVSHYEELHESAAAQEQVNQPDESDEFEGENVTRLQA